MKHLVQLSLFSLALTLGASSVANAQASAPLGRKHLYSETADPKADIAAALTQAKREHKHVILDFGGDWCGDCQVLDIYFHQPANAELLARSFIVVHIFTTDNLDRNVDVAAKYGVPLGKGVPPWPSWTITVPSSAPRRLASSVTCGTWTAPPSPRSSTAGRPNPRPESWTRHAQSQDGAPHSRDDAACTPQRAPA